ncbi:alanine racemase [Kitasatospora sp. DSM 101779]|uniref:alanine racemase n=1 Tax=Kitasatospora sp. DSM 101779 TaxID=2853165 RepID=UPI0021D8F65B|nr:alanine racemase [Kitasatospora sp. DSM 101779]MCU7823689.1 alanine racemase [Kitasatospora sp. DSM 101779]
MTLSLYVDTARWRAHQQAVLAEFPGLVPVAKGNGYGLGNARLAEEAARLGTGMLAVGTAREAADVSFPGDLLVLTPYRPGEDAPAVPPGTIRTVAHVEALRALPAGTRVVVECMTSMRRHGIARADLAKLPTDGPVVEGFALHLPLDRPDGSDPVGEVADWMAAIAAAGPAPASVYLSHLAADDVARLSARHPDTAFRSRIGTRLWLGDVAALHAAATVLDVTAVAKGERYGYRQHKAPSDGHLLVVTGGTAHGVGMEAPKYLHGMLPRAKGLARAGLAAVNRTLSPYAWAGRQLWFAEPPHMQVSILFLPGELKPPVIGDELPLTVRHTTTHFDRVVDHRETLLGAA